jgi:hypothetical protein
VTARKTDSLILLKVLLLASAMNMLVQTAPPTEVEESDASYCADALHDNKTASGETYDKEVLTAAHRTLPFGSKVKVICERTVVLLEQQILMGQVLLTQEHLDHGDVAPLVNGVPAPGGQFKLGDLLVIQRRTLGSFTF